MKSAATATGSTSTASAGIIATDRAVIDGKRPGVANAAAIAAHTRTGAAITGSVTADRASDQSQRTAIEDAATLAPGPGGYSSACGIFLDGDVGQVKRTGIKASATMYISQTRACVIGRKALGDGQARN